MLQITDTRLGCEKPGCKRRHPRREVKPTKLDVIRKYVAHHELVDFGFDVAGHERDGGRVTLSGSDVYVTPSYLGGRYKVIEVRGQLYIKKA